MADLKWYTVKGADGKWYTTQSDSPESAKAKILKPKQQQSVPSMAQNLGIPPLTSHTAATEYALGQIAGGAGDVISGIASSAGAPKDAFEKTLFAIGGPGAVMAWRTGSSVVGLGKQALQVPAAIRDIMQSGGENAGLTAASQIVPRTAGGVAATAAMEKAPAIADKLISTPVRIALQRAGGAGKEPVLLEAMKRQADLAAEAKRFARERADVARSNQEALGEHAARMDEAKYAHEQAVAEAKAKYEQEAADYERATAESKAAHARKVAEARKEWVDKSFAAKQAEAQNARISARKESLSRGMEQYSKNFLDNIQQTYQRVKGNLDQRWNALRSTPSKSGIPKILGDAPINSRTIADGIDIAEKKYLAGSPESIKQFRDLMNFMAEEGAKMGGQGAESGSITRPISWNEGRIHYSALGDRLFSGDLPGNVRNAIRYVRDDVLGKELGDTAQSFGAGETYQKLLNDHSQYERDWRDMSSVTTKGGSPLARARMAPNAATLTPQVIGKTGDLLLERLSKYREFGASPTTGAAIRRLNTEVHNLPRPQMPHYPGKLGEIPEPKAGTPPGLKLPEFKPPRAPRLRSAEPPEALPEIDPVAIRRKRLTQYAARPIEFWDLVNPVRWIERPAMSSEAIREWVARQPRKELEP